VFADRAAVTSSSLGLTSEEAGQLKATKNKKNHIAAAAFINAVFVVRVME